ncbi:MAG: VWA domain-containing protein, partial [Planctomycetota bacterium]
MIALTALAVPIIIHLRRQRKAKVIDWAAMQFLSHSLVNRRRGLALEHLLLLLCRCLLIVMFVLAMARPQISAASVLWWIPALALGLVSLIALTWAVVTKMQLWKRLMAGTTSLLLIALLVALATLNNEVLPEWDQPRDVAIVMDTSSSMQLEVEGKSNFQRATEEASLLVDSLPGGSTVSLVNAGPIVTLPSPARANLRQVAEELGELEVVGGGADLHQAIEQATLALESSPNARKQIVVFSDKQLRPWQQAAKQAALKPRGESPDVDVTGKAMEEEADGSIPLFCRALPLPSELADVSVLDLQLDAGTVSIHRPLRIVAELLNSGSSNASNLEIELLVNDKVVRVETVPLLEQNSRTSVRFEYQFEQAGWTTISARLKGKDGLDSNNVMHRVVHVREELPVLIINGNASDQAFERPATFLQLALDPTSLDEQDDAKDMRRQLTKVEIVDAADIRQVKNFSDYHVVVLCDVPRLPTEEADELAEFVEQGGGLWVLPGQRCQEDFYNGWSVNASSELVMPMRLVQRAKFNAESEKSLEIDFDSVSHVTLDPLFETGQHDLTELQVSAYWRLKNRPNAQPKQVAMRLTNGDPLLVEQALGRGRVLVSSLSFDSLESNFISRVSFPVLTHLWVEHLANSNAIDFNHRPQRNLLVRLAESRFESERNLTLETPDGSEREVTATVSEADEQLSVEVGLAAAPGVYQLRAETSGETKSLPFTVKSDKDEFDLTAASENKLA